MPTELTRERRKKKVRNGFSIEIFQVRSCKMQPAGGFGDFSYGIILSFTMVWCPQIPLFIFASFFVAIWWRAGLVQTVESYRLWPEGSGFESRSPRIAQARVNLATDTLPQTLHRAGALCTGYVLFFVAIWSLTFFLLGLDVDPIHTVAHRSAVLFGGRWWIPNGACNQKHAWNILQSAVCSVSVRK